MDPLEQEFRILEVSHDRGRATERGGERGTASARFIDDVLFGYATIESVVAAMRDLHDLTKEALESRARDAAPQTASGEVDVTSLNSPQVAPRAVIMHTKSARYQIDRK